MQASASNFRHVGILLTAIGNNASSTFLSSFLLVNLDCTSGLHLLPQVVLVLSDRAIPSADGLVLAYHDVFRDLVEQSKHNQHWSTNDRSGGDSYLKS
jgi:hypothetical protein